MSAMKLSIVYVALLVSQPFWNAVDAAQADTSLNGQWTTDCLPTGKNGRHGYITQVVITDDQIEASYQQYAGNSCDSPTVHTQFVGSILRQANEGDHLDLEFVVRSLTLTLNAKDVVDFYNKKMAESPSCEKIEWRENDPVSVAGKACGPLSFANIGTRLFERAWIDGTRLRFGALLTDWNNISADKRPATPLDTTYFRVGQ